MTNTLLTAALAALCLLTCSSASAWSKQGEKLIFEGGEVSHCSALAMDATSIMLGRQSNEPPVYPHDEYEGPSAATLTSRDMLSRMVLTYPTRDNEVEKHKDLEHFVNTVRGMCVKAYIESVPQTPAN
ncbi:hypothetical protein [Pseudomonas sp. BP8]|uniref:hypothetical protein n=1 Tax=Pseudomonas sp. BP8 TaxID=2817864 RepID=UPI001AE3AF38|nr:hypothetical protein [Pseudomonas sp. BP8]MBP2262617.1 hypothetical protein [Pseudomonas sp. BP8]HDS1734664.1 hypothetical protein [Pseudomonas putida]